MMSCVLTMPSRYIWIQRSFTELSCQVFHKNVLVNKVTKIPEWYYSYSLQYVKTKSCQSPNCGVKNKNHQYGGINFSSLHGFQLLEIQTWEKPGTLI